MSHEKFNGRWAGDDPPFDLISETHLLRQLAQETGVDRIHSSETAAVPRPADTAKPMDQAKRKQVTLIDEVRSPSPLRPRACCCQDLQLFEPETILHEQLPCTQAAPSPSAASEILEGDEDSGGTANQRVRSARTEVARADVEADANGQACAMNT